MNEQYVFMERGILDSVEKNLNSICIIHISLSQGETACVLSSESMCSVPLCGNMKEKVL